MSQHTHGPSCRYLGCSMTDFDNQIRERHPLDTINIGDLAALRRIIAEVIDNGDGGNYWKFHLGQHDIHIKAVTKADLDAVRNRFIERVIESVIATAAPATGGGDK